MNIIDSDKDFIVTDKSSWSAEEIDALQYFENKIDLVETKTPILTLVVNNGKTIVGVEDYD